VHRRLPELERLLELAEDRAWKALRAVLGFVYVSATSYQFLVFPLTDCRTAVFMAVDMLGRLHAVVGERKTFRGKKIQ
jgi:hypothetical protein